MLSVKLKLGSVRRAQLVSVREQGEEQKELSRIHAPFTVLYDTVRVKNSESIVVQLYLVQRFKTDTVYKLQVERVQLPDSLTLLH